MVSEMHLSSMSGSVIWTGRQYAIHVYFTCLCFHFLCKFFLLIHFSMKYLESASPATVMLKSMKLQLVPSLPAKQHLLMGWSLMAHYVFFQEATSQMKNFTVFKDSGFQCQTIVRYIYYFQLIFR